jgi:hypothetical protein
MSETLVEKIKRFENLTFMQDAMRLRYEELRRSLIPPEIQAQLDDIDAEQQTERESIDAGLAKLKAEIQEEVVMAGKTVEGEYYQVVFNKGRTTWDNKKLEGYAAAHPELQNFQTHHEPTVSFRVKK